MLYSKKDVHTLIFNTLLLKECEPSSEALTSKNTDPRSQNNKYNDNEMVWNIARITKCDTETWS